MANTPKESNSADETQFDKVVDHFLKTPPKPHAPPKAGPPGKVKTAGQKDD